MEPPNILWLMGDQHHAGCLGHAGDPNAKTPHLDGLADEGFRFNRAYCNNPICGPSRTTLLSGQYPHTHGITGNYLTNYNRTTPPNIATHFRNYGYQTALVGKAHLPLSWLHAGFEYLRFSDLCDAKTDDPLSCHYFRHLVDAGLADQYDHGQLPEGHPGRTLRAFTSEIPLEHSLEVWTGDEAVQFLDQRDTERPFFLKVSFQRPHDPLSPSPESLHLFNPEEISLPANHTEYFETKFSGKPAFQRAYVRDGKEGYPYRPHDEADLKRQLAHYLMLVTEIDTQIGRVIEHLKASGEWENTIIVYLADHGDFAGEHGLSLKNFGIYEAIHRVPFIWRWPGGPSGKSDEIVELVDFAPTLAAAAGLPPLEGTDGRDIRPVAEGKAPGLDSTVCEWDATAHSQGSVFAIRDERFRLVYYCNWADDGELYEMSEDPGELVNLWSSPDHGTVRERLIRRILAHVGRFSRNCSPDDDRMASRDNSRDRLHSKGALWSQMTTSVE